MINTNNVNDLLGAAVYGSDDDKIGTVGQVYVDPNTQSPLWVTVKTGLFGSSESFAPLDNASYDGEVVRVAYDKSFVKDAPRIADDGALSEEEEDALYAYYGNGTGTANVGSYDTTDRDVTDRDLTDGNTVGHDTSGPNTDDAMTRSEERLNVGTQKVQTGRARLRKYIVTEEQTVTVPVTHEEVRLEREPITDANVGDALRGGDLTSEEHEVTLTEERVVVNKETVPVERVRLDKETVTENQQVNEEVRHEEIELVDGGTVSDGAVSDGVADSDRRN